MQNRWVERPSHRGDKELFTQKILDKDGLKQ